MDFSRIDEGLSTVRVHLGEPRPQAPSLRMALEKSYARIAWMFHQAELVNSAWAVNSFTFQTTPGVNDYPLATPADFGRLLRVTTPIAPDYYGLWPYGECNVTVTELATLIPGDGDSGEMWWSDYWGLYSADDVGAGLYGGIPRLALYHRTGEQSGGNWRFRAWPTPTAQRSFTCFYTVGDYLATSTLDSSPVFSRFQHVWTTDAACDLLPMT